MTVPRQPSVFSVFDIYFYQKAKKPMAGAY